MKMIIRIAALLVLCATCQSQQLYLQLEALQYANDTLTRDRSTASARISSKETMHEVFYWSDGGSSGTFGNSIWADKAPENALETYCHFTLRGNPAKMRLVGTIIAIKVTAGNTIESGHRESVDTPIVINYPIDIHIGTLPNGHRVVLRAKLLETSPNLSFECGINQLKLITINFYEGKVYNMVQNSRGLAPTSQLMATEFSIPVDSSVWQQLKYDADVRFSPAIDDIASATTSTMTIIRRYAIDTLHHGDSFVPDVRYESKYSRELTFVPGKALKIVIPPDTPSIHGFNVQDTLVVYPGR